MPRSLPTEANQFYWQVEAGVDLGATSREQAGAGESGEAAAASLPHIHTRLGVQHLEKGLGENTSIHPHTAHEDECRQLFRLYHLRSSSA